MMFLNMYLTMNTKKGSNLNEGDIVVVFGQLDKRVRERNSDKLVMGTLYYFLTENRVCVIIDDNELWIGERREIALAAEQQ
jgi:hypothetical protein